MSECQSHVPNADNSKITVLSLLSKLALYFPVLVDTDCLGTETACGHRLLGGTDCLWTQTACGHRLLGGTHCLGAQTACGQTAWGHRLLADTDFRSVLSFFMN